MTQRTFRQIFLVTCVNGLSLSGISYKKSFSMKIFSRFNVIYLYSDTSIMIHEERQNISATFIFFHQRCKSIIRCILTSAQWSYIICWIIFSYLSAYSLEKSSRFLLFRSTLSTFRIQYRLNFLDVILICSIYNQAFQKSKWVLSPFPLEMKKSQSEILIRYTSNINFK